MGEQVTREEIERLKANWRDDPCFDLAPFGREPGYESYADELAQFEAECKAKWKAERDTADERWRVQHGVDNDALAKYLKGLEWRIKELEKLVDEILNFSTARFIQDATK